VVVEPGARSLQTYEKVKQLAADLGIFKVSVVCNKVRSEEDRQYLRSKIPEEDLLGFISYDTDVIDADRNGASPYDYSPKALAEIMAIKAKIDSKG
jgi:CO dehydrogenase maturation factor